MMHRSVAVADVQFIGAGDGARNVVLGRAERRPRVAALRSEADVARIAAQVPLRRLATPADHAQVMLVLASDGAAYLNGTVQDVNGGRVMM